MAVASPLAAQEKSKVVIDQDCADPGGTDMQAVLAIVNSPKADVLGITVVSGDAWRDEEVQHALRLLEIIGRTDIPVVPGAVFPIVNSKESTARWEKLYGKVVYQGAWNWGKPVHGPFEVPPLPEGSPRIKAAGEDAAHFLIRMVREYPHQVTINAGGPLMNLALAEMIDPEFASLAKELIIMGGAIAPEVPYPRVTTNRRGFNFWWDPEAVHMTLSAPGWHKITVTTVDISIKTRMGKDIIAEIAKSQNPAAQYLAQYADEEYRWDELTAAAWLDPSIITKQTQLYMDMDYSHCAGYGNTLVWVPGTQPGLGEQLVNVPQDLDLAKFDKMFIGSMTRPTPGAHSAAGAK
ncbi:MAG: nucleoside hydrolase [Candidatus Sulfotelmatobacter sp.]|jgi:inosine-uridine nucleoside N-ribohydrolase